MLRAYVIRDLILDDLHPARVRRIHQRAVAVECSEAVLYGVVIDDAVAMVAAVFALLAVVHVVGIVVHGREPQGGNAERIEVR